MVVVGIPVAVGMYVWRGVPFGRFGVLLVASGVVWLVATFSLADGAVVYSIGRLADWVGWAAVLYLVLVFPDGRLESPLDRRLAADHRSCCSLCCGSRRRCWSSVIRHRWSG